ncbi:MAG: hypothetical protein JW889_02615 [Verrucomicrobia bacterium]|nr:hypothetical protein [Verrucomicrobiota bacterium]
MAMSRLSRAVFRLGFLVVTTGILILVLHFYAVPDGERVLIKDVPHVEAKPGFDGEACVAMALGTLGRDVTPEQVFNRAGVDPMLGRGCTMAELLDVLTRIGFEPGEGIYSARSSDGAGGIDVQWQALLDDLKQGIPSIVRMRASRRPNAPECFRLVIGYALGSDRVIYRDPASRSTRTRRLSRAQFLELWPIRNEQGARIVVRIRLATSDPATINLDTGEPAAGFTDADFARHLRALKPKVPRAFSIVIEPPFVVIGDEPAEVVQQRADATVKWFSDRIRELYFAKDPPAIYDIWLFRNDASFRKYSKELFGEERDTPYGFFSRTHGALIMNIDTGGGTLCHEMVHAFMPSNFPDCPTWFNEGLASLYEQSGERDGRVVGLTNWRLAGLQKAVRAGELPSFETLCAMPSDTFYGSSRGNNYAQARYLCYLLQEKDLLVEYYHAFVKNAASDPTGYETLKAVLGLETDEQMAEFQRQWADWVLELRFP